MLKYVRDVSSEFARKDSSADKLLRHRKLRVETLQPRIPVSSSALGLVGMALLGDMVGGHDAPADQVGHGLDELWGQPDVGDKGSPRVEQDVHENRSLLSAAPDDQETSAGSGGGEALSQKPEGDWLAASPQLAGLSAHSTFDSLETDLPADLYSDVAAASQAGGAAEFSADVPAAGGGAAGAASTAVSVTANQPGGGGGNAAVSPGGPGRHGRPAPAAPAASSSLTLSDDVPATEVALDDADTADSVEATSTDNGLVATTSGCCGGGCCCDPTASVTAGTTEFDEQCGTGCGYPSGCCDPGTDHYFTISLSGEASECRDVYFSFSESASDPADSGCCDFNVYTDTGISLTPDEYGQYSVEVNGNSSTKVYIGDTNDGRVEDDEIVQLDIESDEQYDIDPSGCSATMTIEDDDAWVVTTTPSDGTATERMAEVTQDTGKFLVSRTGGSDFSYGVTVQYSIATGTNYATYGDDYSLTLEDANGDAIAGASISPDAIGNTCTVYFPSETQNAANITQMYIVVTPTFDWDDEGDLFDPSGSSEPDAQTGEKVALTMTSVTWADLANSEVTHDPIGTTTAQEVEIKDGAILEVYLDYDYDNAYDVEESIEDDPCYVRYNNDDDDYDGTEDRNEYPGNPQGYNGIEDENDLTKALVYAWVETPGDYEFQIELVLPTATGSAVKYWNEQSKVTLLETTRSFGTTDYRLMGTVSSAETVVDEIFWIEGAAMGAYQLTANANCYLNSVYVSGKGTSEQTVLRVLGMSVDLDIDSDNNGYVNTVNTAANDYRASAEDNLEESTAKPITYFGCTLDDATMAYVPISLAFDTLSNDSEFSLWFDSTKLEISTANDGTGTTITSGDWMDVSGSVEYYVKATATSGCDLTIMAKLRSDLGGTLATEAVVDVDRVLVAIQDNSTQMTDWVVPNGWLINANDSVTTPTPTDEDAVGPQKEWTDLNSNSYNKGDAYTKDDVTDEFTLAFTVALGSRYVQADNNGTQYTVDGDSRKLSFVANSGVKIGDCVVDPVQNSDTRDEIAIFDVERMVERFGGLTTFQSSAAIGGGVVDITYDGVDYVNENLTQLLPCVPYNLPTSRYNEIYDLSVADNTTKVTLPTTWEDYYQVLKDFYDFFSALGDTYQMKIENTSSSLVVSVRAVGAQDYIKVYEGPAYTGDYRLHLQAHWGSKVTFSGISLDD